MARSLNLILKLGEYARVDEFCPPQESEDALQKTIKKAGQLTFLTAISAALPWVHFIYARGHISTPFSLLILLSLVAMVVILPLVIIKKTMAPKLVPYFAVCEGLFVGSVSIVLNLFLPNVPLQALIIIFSMLFCFLGLIYLWREGPVGLIAIISAAGSMACLYGFREALLTAKGYDMHIGFSQGTFGLVLCCIIAVLFVIFMAKDCKSMRYICNQDCPEYMQWYTAWGMAAGLILIYLGGVVAVLSIFKR